MPEILTESFCERCGTRYTFESTAPRKTRRLGQFKTLGKGVKNWVMSDDSSLDEAMAEARSDDERELTTQQLDAFHSTFNFCMSCRQYTCANCWNTADGRCLSCAPNLGQEILPAPFPDAPVFEPVRIEVEAWPEVDLSSPAAAANGAGLGIEGLPANGIHANGNGFHPTSNGLDSGDDIPQFDAAARLAFLSGETLAPPPPPEPVAPEPVAFDAAAPEDAVAFEAAPPDLLTPEPVAEAPAAPEPVEVAPIAAEPFRAEPDVLIPMATEAVTAEPVAFDPVDAAQPLADAPAAVIDDVAGEAAATPTGSAPIDPVVEERAAAGAARTSDLLTRFRPGQSIDAELAAYEAQRASEPVAESAVEAESAVVDLSPAATWQDAAEPEVAPVVEAVAAPAEAPVAEPQVVEAVAAAAEAPVAEPQVAEPEHPGVAAVVAGGLLAADLANPVREADHVAAEPAVVEPVAVAEPAPAEPVAVAEPVAEPVAVERVAPEPVAVEPVPIAADRRRAGRRRAGRGRAGRRRTRRGRAGRRRTGRRRGRAGRRRTGRRSGAADRTPPARSRGPDRAADLADLRPGPGRSRRTARAGARRPNARRTGTPHVRRPSRSGRFASISKSPRAWHSSPTRRADRATTCGPLRPARSWPSPRRVAPQRRRRASNPARAAVCPSPRPRASAGAAERARAEPARPSGLRRRPRLASLDDPRGADHDDREHQVEPDEPDEDRAERSVDEVPGEHPGRHEHEPAGQHVQRDRPDDRRDPDRLARSG